MFLIKITKSFWLCESRLAYKSASEVVVSVKRDFLKDWHKCFFVFNQSERETLKDWVFNTPKARRIFRAHSEVRVFLHFRYTEDFQLLSCNFSHVSDVDTKMQKHWSVWQKTVLYIGTKTCSCTKTQSGKQSNKHVCCFLSIKRE